MGDNAMLVWKGVPGDQRLWWSRQHEGGSWQNPQPVSYFATNSGIGAVSDGQSKAWVAWRGADDDNRIWWAKWDSGNWSDQGLPTDVPRTSDRPALAYFRERPLMAWRGAAPDETIWYSWGFGHQNVAGGLAASTHGPALTVHRDLLYMAWKGSGGSAGLWWNTFDGDTWSSPQRFDAGATSHGPALVSDGHALHMVWKGAGTDTMLWRASFTDRWGQQRPMDGRSTHGPAVALMDADAIPWVMTVWKGAGDDLIWTCKQFHGNDSVAQNGTVRTSDTPAIVPTYITNL